MESIDILYMASARSHQNSYSIRHALPIDSTKGIHCIAIILTVQLDREELKLQSLVEYFYAIPGVPSKAVKPEQLNSGLHHHKIFIQSTSQGSRCLKAGTKILYLKEVLVHFMHT